MVVRINKEGNYKQTKKVSNLLNKEKFLAFRDKHIKIFKKMKKKKLTRNKHPVYQNEQT